MGMQSKLVSPSTPVCAIFSRSNDIGTLGVEQLKRPILQGSPVGLILRSPFATSQEGR